MPLSLVQNTREGSWRTQKVDKQSRRRFKETPIQIHIIAKLYPVQFLNFYANLSSFLAENKFPVYVFRKRQIIVFTKSRTLCWEFEQKGHIKFGLDHVAAKNNAIFNTTYCNQLQDASSMNSKYVLKICCRYILKKTAHLLPIFWSNPIGQHQK